MIELMGVDDTGLLDGCVSWDDLRWRQAAVELAQAVRQADISSYTRLWRLIDSVPDRHRQLFAARQLIPAAHEKRPAHLLRAARGLLELLRAQPHDPFMLRELAVLFARLGELAAAEALLEAVLRLDATDARTRTDQATVRRLKQRRAPRSGGADAKQLAQQARRLAAGVQLTDPASVTLTLVMIVRDEQDMLPACLKSVHGLVDDMVIVDTGSEDDTRQIARSFGATVVEFPWTGSFAEARNVGLEHAHGDWILMLDADERLLPEEAPALRELLGRPWREAVVFTEINYTGAEGSGAASTHRAYRVFRNRPEYRYEGAIHEQNTLAMPLYLPDRFEQSPLRILHYGYLKERIDDRGKRDRNRLMLEAAVQADPTDLYNRFQLGSEYMAIEDYPAAYEHLRFAWSGTLEHRQTHMSWAPVLIGRLAECARHLGDHRQAARHADDGLKLYPQFTDLVLLHAELARDQHRFEDAVTLTERALQMGDAPRFMGGTVGAGTHMAMAKLGELHELVGERHLAVRCFEQALDSYPEAMGPIAPLCRALLADGLPVEDVLDRLRPIARRQLSSGGVLLASALHDAGEPAAARELFAEVLEHAPSNSLARMGLIETSIAAGELEDAAQLCATTEAGFPDRRFIAERALLLAALTQTPVDPLLDRYAAHVTEDERALWRALTTAGDTPALAPAAGITALAALGPLLRVQRFDLAERAIALVKRSGLDVHERQCALARLLTSAGFLQSAEDEWIELIDAHGPSADALIGLAHLALAQQQPGRALELAAEACELEPQHAAARHMTAVLLARHETSSR